MSLVKVAKRKDITFDYVDGYAEVEVLQGACDAARFLNQMKQSSIQVMYKVYLNCLLTETHVELNGMADEFGILVNT